MELSWWILFSIKQDLLLKHIYRRGCDELKSWPKVILFLICIYLSFWITLASEKKLGILTSLQKTMSVLLHLLIDFLKDKVSKTAIETRLHTTAYTYIVLMIFWHKALASDCFSFLKIYTRDLFNLLSTEKHILTT